MLSGCRIRRDRLTRQIEELLPLWSMAPVAAALQAMRGVALVVAVTVVAEVGDFRRFTNARQLMAYLGLVPSEHSSGSTVRRGWDYQGRQCACASRTDRGRLDLSHAGAGEPETSRSPRAAIRGHPGHCLESAGPVVRAISTPRCIRQAEGRGHHRDRPRDGRLHLGDRPRCPAWLIDQAAETEPTKRRSAKIRGAHCWRQDHGGEPSCLL